MSSVKATSSATEVVPEPGEHIAAACERLARAAPAFMVFNDRRIDALPGDNIALLVSKHEAHHHAPILLDAYERSRRELERLRSLEQRLWNEDPAWFEALTGTKFTFYKGARMNNAEKPQAPTNPGRLTWVVRETLTGMFATLTFGEWVREVSRAAEFTRREDARKFARALKAGPRQFAGFGQKTRIEVRP